MRYEVNAVMALSLISTGALSVQVFRCKPAFAKVVAQSREPPVQLPGCIAGHSVVWQVRGFFSETLSFQMESFKNVFLGAS